MRSLIMLAALSLLTAPALADPTTSAPAKPAKGSPEEVVCHREAPTGSLVPSKRICMTRAQWQAQADVARSQTQDMEDRGRVTSCGSSSPGGC